MDRYGYTLVLPRLVNGITHRELLVNVNGTESIYDIGLNEVSPEFIFDDGDMVSVRLYNYGMCDDKDVSIEFVVDGDVEVAITDKISIVVVRPI